MVRTYIMYTGRSCSFFTSAAIMGVQIGDVQAGLTHRMIYQRHVDGFGVFPLCGVWFSLQDLPSIPTYFVISFVRMLG
jgi:hypothetical protein